MPDRCKDCVAEGITTTREVVGPGPRCKTHDRAARRMSSAKAHDAMIARTYGVPRGFYSALIEAQDGRCAICQRARGVTKRLALDHDHAKKGVDSARGALCSLCNSMLAHVRSDPEMLRRAARYLEDPPAQKVLMAWDGEAS